MAWFGPVLFGKARKNKPQKPFLNSQKPLIFATPKGATGGGSPVHAFRVFNTDALDRGGLDVNAASYRLTTLCLPPDQGHFVFIVVAMSITKTNREHSFDVELAEIHGIEKAILLKNFDYWARENERKQVEQFFMGGRYWTAESISSLTKKYKYMKATSLRRWVNELQETEWLEIVKRQSDVSFYRPGKVFELWNTGQEWEVRQNGAMNGEGHPAKMAQSLGQNGAIIGPKWRDNCAILADNNIDSNIELNIESYIENNVGFQNFQNPKTENQTPQPFTLEAEKNNTPPNSAAPPPPPAENAGPITVTIFEPPTTEQHQTPQGPIQVETFNPPRVEVISPKARKENAAAQELQFAAEAIEYLNQKAGRSFRANVASNAKGIVARHREGFNMEQVKKMIDHMCRKWGSDREMQDNLNPVTLFRDSNFERYYQSAEAAAKLGPAPQQQNGNFQRFTYTAPAPGKEMDF